MDSPLVSVIVPVYNVEPYLKKCVRSICGQTYTYMEIILVDDGSTDGSGRMCDRFGAEDSRIRVIHKENGGLSSARNAGLDSAKGTYVYFVDSDDWVQESLVEETVSLMEWYDYDQCIWGAEIVEEGKESYYMGRRGPLTLRFSTLEQKRKVLCRWLLNYRLGWTVWSRVFRREIIERNHLRFENEQEIGAEDLDFSFRYLACCQSLHYLPKPFYFYWQRSGSIMSSSTLQNRLTCMLCMIRREEQMLSVQPLFQPFYPYGGVILVSFASIFLEDQSIQQGLARMLACFQASENWSYLLEQARLAWKDRTGMRCVCGLRLGGQVCAFYRYILEQDPGPFCRWNRLQRAYERFRDMKSSLLYKR